VVGSKKCPERRLFFACWPKDKVRAEIVARRQLIDDMSPRRVPDHNLHLTLLFLGNQPGGCVEALYDAVDSLQSRGFTFNLDRFGWFRDAQVVWLGGAAGESALALVADLSSAMLGLGLDFEQRTFCPHITLYRKVSCRPILPAPPCLDWRIDHFALIESLPARPYQVLRTWPLSL